MDQAWPARPARRRGSSLRQAWRPAASDRATVPARRGAVPQPRRPRGRARKQRLRLRQQQQQPPARQRCHRSERQDQRRRTNGSGEILASWRSLNSSTALPSDGLSGDFALSLGSARSCRMLLQPWRRLQRCGRRSTWLRRRRRFCDQAVSCTQRWHRTAGAFLCRWCERQKQATAGRPAELSTKSTSRALQRVSWRC